MARALLILANDSVRDRAIAWIKKLPTGTRVIFQEAKRTTEQNDKMWAMLTEVATQTLWHGMKLSADDWKLIFMAGLNQEMRIVPNLDATGFVNLGRSTSKLSKQEMSDLMALIEAFGVKNGVSFKDEFARAA